MKTEISEKLLEKKVFFFQDAQVCQELTSLGCVLIKLRCWLACCDKTIGQTLNFGILIKASFNQLTQKGFESSRNHTKANE